MKLGKLIENLDLEEVYDFINLEIIGLTHDSRRVKPGYVFVAIAGHKIDGHHFIEKSLEQGAAAIVSEKTFSPNTRIPQIIVRNSRRALSHLSCCFYENPSQKINVIGITGTNGKTTTAFLTKSIIESKGYDTGLIGTISYQIGKKKIPARETTPESVELQRIIAEMVTSRLKFLVMEVSSHSLVQHRVEDINFTAAVFTNVSPEHLDYHKTITNYMEAKRKLFEGLKSNSYAVLNADDEQSGYFAASTKAHILWYGIKKNADIEAKICRETLDTTVVRLSYAGMEVEVFIPLIGLHNVYNALASAAVAISQGFNLKEVKEGIEAVPIIPGRLEMVPSTKGFVIFVDFAHTPHALEVVLDTLRKLTSGRLILVFGCGGDRDREKRAEMGRIADLNSDIFWITNDNPRSENPKGIIADIQAGITPERDFYVQQDREEAIQSALSKAEKGDIVLIAGKGHEKGQIVKDKVIPFDDKDVIEKIISRN
ncbi:MAG: UDP-N-acetylmuramoyl-L-alanyl-D-glutamate--2,6-diaminopimelate ligase [Candidatus Scalindua sp. AMX11]|nr:MAG: UDP-N-acetylmuramoyl-L-alanyl-D-glutamate--2,6-diaminopimelate ligase [Candidatus Scalindua sp.]NOG85601.1 UDP-N-acetylmuramoyl-L-alanyl-D-glutamate--2,6-diaminopimelate ligase [Planctomycetota bacterium]RZV65368.1 MAG: UDP-N-acetylmuramoyl-L-alanyl-D-glutamate--2,6-diaminopimelate ligase [Candidatus Scalindua sp. SCAELEC01]TDE63478.1 MAG: UDP-N-acetylmuramoyl-L-alanyl-D-glutamate--2,6-diaminopimelate ligase [Candidatus Scalindua sp. AMX11]GJQ57297.1 MAG: UDP-N-acetylmuramoyl-L-alanyl-D